MQIDIVTGLDYSGKIRHCWTVDIATSCYAMVLLLCKCIRIVTSELCSQKFCINSFQTLRGKSDSLSAVLEVGNFEANK